MNSSLHGPRFGVRPASGRAIPGIRRGGCGPALAVFAALLLCGVVVDKARADATGTPPFARVAQAEGPQAPAREGAGAVAPDRGTLAPQTSPQPAQEAPASSAEATPAADDAAGQTAGPAAIEAEPVTGTGDAGSDAAAPETGEPGAADPATEPLQTEARSAEAFGPRSDDLPRDLSPMGMFMGADIVVKAVIAGLILASFLTWVIWLAKTVELLGARGRARRVLAVLNGARTLDDAARGIGGDCRGPAALMVSAAREEAKVSDVAIAHAGGGGLKDRVASALERIEFAAGRRMARGTGILATIGSTAPFVGLFGTVWGIMNAFIGISEAQTTNLAVVAPGIAEALLATALGLVAAIPAVIIYNAFARSIASYRQLLADAASAVQRLISRDLDFRNLPPSRSAGALGPGGGRPSQKILEEQEAK